MSKLTSTMVLDVVQKLYSGGGWAFIRELRLGTGRAKRAGWKNQPKHIKQRLDALAYNTWPSAQEIVAFEVKVSRSDFLAELHTPGKRAAGLSLSNRFYFVTTPGVAYGSEIPPECGWIEVGEHEFFPGEVKAFIREEAPRRELEVHTTILPQYLVNSLVRRLAKAEGTYVTPVRHMRGRRVRKWRRER